MMLLTESTSGACCRVDLPPESVAGTSFGTERLEKEGLHVDQCSASMGPISMHETFRCPPVNIAHRGNAPPPAAPPKRRISARDVRSLYCVGDTSITYSFRDFDENHTSFLRPSALRLLLLSGRKIQDEFSFHLP